ncbi:unnamed protein product [Dimorphilus gyrociliatus]|uniref:tRNA pseudouridine(55) synthase n=1 Tax=Dimorphilus gyrociliatus TaxID=2664684 RepID=A0A7I8VMW9_9ANNE|nr:unnamed protein product [Dimorphilus gyrociliatus]
MSDKMDINVIPDKKLTTKYVSSLSKIYWKDEESFKKTIAALNSYGVCPRCCLRFLAIDNQSIYRSSFQWMADFLKEREETMCSNICCACLGVLQEKYCREEFRKEIIKTLMEAKYEYDSFFVAITLPVSTMMREHSIWLKLAEQDKTAFNDYRRRDLASLKDCWKWVNGDDLGESLGRKSEYSTESACFEISLNFSHKTQFRECYPLDDYFEEFRKRKSDDIVYTRSSVQRALVKLSDDRFRKLYSSPPTIPKDECTVEIQFKQDSIFVAGRYNKYSRKLSQTPWVLDSGERRTNSSVQEMLCDSIKSHFKADSFVFTSSGREDVDVKMLGEGRPFIVELINPHVTTISKSELKDITKKINTQKDIGVRDLQLALRSDTMKLKEGEEQKKKSYSAFCWSKEPITQEELDSKLSNIKDLKVNQRTPIRVLHRRTNSYRTKMIYSLEAKSINEKHFILYLTTQAGTYIKEFVHSDFGRTTPSLGSILGVECDILELNVTAVDLDWPERLGDEEK